MRLLASQCFFLTLITVSFICGIIFQYLSPLLFPFFVFILSSFSYTLLASRQIPIQFDKQLQCLIRFHYKLHLAVRFHYNTPYRKYSLNCKQLFKTRKEMMRKNCYNLLKNIFKYYASTISLYYKYIIGRYRQPCSQPSLVFSRKFFGVQL